MSEMKVNNLNVDLIQNSAAISLVKFDQPAPDKPGSTTIVSINLPMGSPGDELESALKRKAINQARDALVEAIKVLEAHAA